MFRRFRFPTREISNGRSVDRQSFFSRRSCLVNFRDARGVPPGRSACDLTIDFKYAVHLIPIRGQSIDRPPITRLAIGGVMSFPDGWLRDLSLPPLLEIREE